MFTFCLFFSRINVKMSMQTPRTQRVSNYLVLKPLGLGFFLFAAQVHDVWSSVLKAVCVLKVICSQDWASNKLIRVCSDVLYKGVFQSADDTGGLQDIWSKDLSFYYCLMINIFSAKHMPKFCLLYRFYGWDDMIDRLRLMPSCTVGSIKTTEIIGVFFLLFWAYILLRANRSCITILEVFWHGWLHLWIFILCCKPFFVFCWAKPFRLDVNIVCQFVNL